MKVLFGLFLIAHGLVHASYLTPDPNDPRYPFNFDHDWFADLAGSAAKPAAIILTAIAVICFATAGMALLGVPGAATTWKLLILAGAISSTLLLVLFWHPWLVLGIAINLILLYGVLRLGWTITSS